MTIWLQEAHIFILESTKHGSNMKFSLVAVAVAFLCTTVSVFLHFFVIKLEFKKIIFLGCFWSTINSKCIIRRIGSFGIIWFQWPCEWMGWKTSMHHWHFGQRSCWRIGGFVDQNQKRFGSTYWWLAKMLIEWNHFRSDCVSLTGTK